MIRYERYEVLEPPHIDIRTRYLAQTLSESAQNLDQSNISFLHESQNTLQLAFLFQIGTDNKLTRF